MRCPYAAGAIPLQSGCIPSSIMITLNSAALKRDALLYFEPRPVSARGREPPHRGSLILCVMSSAAGKLENERKVD